MEFGCNKVSIQSRVDGRVVGLAIISSITQPRTVQITIIRALHNNNESRGGLKAWTTRAADRGTTSCTCMPSTILHAAPHSSPIQLPSSAHSPTGPTCTQAASSGRARLTSGGLSKVEPQELALLPCAVRPPRHKVSVLGQCVNVAADNGPQRSAHREAVSTLTVQEGLARDPPSPQKGWLYVQWTNMP